MSSPSSSISTPDNLLNESQKNQVSQNYPFHFVVGSIRLIFFPRLPSILSSFFFNKLLLDLVEYRIKLWWWHSFSLMFFVLFWPFIITIIILFSELFECVSNQIRYTWILVNWILKRTQKTNWKVNWTLNNQFQLIW